MIRFNEDIEIDYDSVLNRIIELPTLILDSLKDFLGEGLKDIDIKKGRCDLNTDVNITEKI